jgi:hypothetical protein
MASKRKVSPVVEESKSGSKRKPNGIKGITAVQKSNDSLRDELLETLRNSGIEGSVESKIVFAHTGLYVCGHLFGWVGPTGFCVRCSNVAQKKICTSFGCEVMDSGNHKSGNYFTVSEKIYKDASKLRDLAEQIVSASPVKKVKSVTTKK